MKVGNMIGKNGKAIQNQFSIVDDDHNYYFQSYDSIIVKISKGKVYLDKKYWNYSTTTGKYRNQFLNESTKQTELKIRSGEYKLIDLNT